MKNKIFSILTITIIMLILMIDSVYAADSYVVGLSTSAESVLPGGTVVLHVTIPTIAVEKGVGTLAGTIEYDTSVFDAIAKSNIKNKEDWESVTFNPANGKFVTLTDSGETLKESTEVFDITFKVLDTAKAGDTTIKITNISSSDGDKDIATTDVSKTIKISSKETQGTTNTSTNTSANTSTKANNTAKNNVAVLPYAGESDIALIGIGILIAGAVIGYFKFKSLKEIL